MIQVLQVAAPIDPVGTPPKNQQISEFIDQLKKKWDDTKAIVAKTGKLSIQYSVKFLVLCLNSLIIFIESVLIGDSGADKKAAVLAALSVVYDYVVKETFPIWLKPFAGKIKSFLIGIVASVVIDWVVKNYNEGTWQVT